MKKLFTIIALILSFSLTSCDLLYNEPPYSLDYSEWESAEVYISAPGGVTIGLIYVLEFNSSSRYTLTTYNSSSIYGESITGTYSYARPYLALSGYYTSMTGEAYDYNYMELYDSYYGINLRFYRK